ncbi:MAG: hypothetical protein ACOYN0_14960 [Phycisphaerales bacterium]
MIDTPPGTTRCAACGYDLASLGTGALCPECGKRNDPTSSPDLLRGSSLGFLATLARGAGMIETAWVLKALLNGFAIVAGLVAGLKPILARVKTPLGLGWLDAIPSTASLNLVIVPMTLCVDAIALAGWWMLTTPTPIEIEGDKRRRARRVLRVLLSVFLVLEAGKFVAMMSPAYAGMLAGNFRFNAGMPLLVIAASVLGAAVYFGMMIAQFYCSMRHMEDLAERGEDPRLVRHCRIGLWALPVIYVVGAACMLLGPFFAGLGFIWLVGRLRVAIVGHRDAAAKAV